MSRKWESSYISIAKYIFDDYSKPENLRILGLIYMHQMSKGLQTHVREVIPWSFSHSFF